jgi:hypothetical protein
MNLIDKLCSAGKGLALAAGLAVLTLLPSQKVKAAEIYTDPYFAFQVGASSDGENFDRIIAEEGMQKLDNNGNVVADSTPGLDVFDAEYNLPPLPPGVSRTFAFYWTTNFPFPYNKLMQESRPVGDTDNSATDRRFELDNLSAGNIAPLFNASEFSDGTHLPGYPSKTIWMDLYNNSGGLRWTYNFSDMLISGELILPREIPSGSYLTGRIYTLDEAGNQVPLPTAGLLVGSGLVGLVGLGIRRKRKEDYKAVNVGQAGDVLEMSREGAVIRKGVDSKVA